MTTTVASKLLLRDVEVDGEKVDVLIRGAVVTEIGRGLCPKAEDEVIEGDGGALLPGLQDHHLHLLATAAARSSVAVGPAEVENGAGLARVLQRADLQLAKGRWLRAFGYHESVAGELDRDRLDAFVRQRPVRVQHRTGALWMLNTAAIEALQLGDTDPPGAERDNDGRLTGRFYRADDWLRTRLQVESPDLAVVGADLARCGITGVTDATPFADLTGPTALAEARTSGSLPQHVMVMGGIDLVDASLPAPLLRGPVKLVIADGDYDPLDTLVDYIRVAHHHSRPVAIHCVTRVALVLALAAWRASGSHQGDRIEHGSVIPPELVDQIAELQLTVVTQPAFVSDRGDQYNAEVDSEDRPHLYRCRSLMSAGIEVAASSDAPYTEPDPWAAMRAAVSRRTRGGIELGSEESLTVQRALALYQGTPERPGGPPRRVEVGAVADLCLLAGPPPRELAELSADRVTATIIGGSRVH